MARSWSSAGLDLHLDLTPGTGRAEAVAAAIRAAIADGRLPAGATLPSTRALALDLGVARGTVSAAYARLSEQGSLTVRQGAPTRVATPAPPPNRTRGPAGAFAADARPGFSSLDSPRWDLRPGRPCTALFPRADWLAATRAVLARAAPSDFDYPDVRGHASLREALARYLGRARGVTAGPECIVVTPGFGAGLAAVASMLRDRGVRDAQFEDPSLYFFRDVVAEAGLRVSGVRVDGQGLLVDAITAPVVVTTPAHQFPLGMTLSPARRAALAARRDVLVVEDDYDGEFQYGAHRIPALCSLPHSERVLYVGTFSKTLHPGLRLGFIVLPHGLVEAFASARSLTDRHSPGASQEVLARFITEGHLLRHLRRMRELYQERQAVLVDSLRKASGGRLAPEPVDHGMHLALEAPPAVDDTALSHRAGEAGVHLAPLSLYTLASRRRGWLFGYAGFNERQLRQAARLLAPCLAGASRAA